MRSLVKVVKYLGLLWFLCSHESQGQSIRELQDETSGIVQSIKGSVVKKYRSLPPNKQLAASAAVGFVGARLLLNSATRAFKIVGVVFIA
jgi:hypothetical protein